jgi:hypothetical protein
MYPKPELVKHTKRTFTDVLLLSFCSSGLECGVNRYENASRLSRGLTG